MSGDNASAHLISAQDCGHNTNALSQENAELFFFITYKYFILQYVLFTGSIAC